MMRRMKESGGVGAGRRTRYRVLVADDAPGMRALMRTVLSVEDDFEVVGEARHGGEAVRLAESLQPDLVVMDASMPVMTGLEALPAVRRVCPDARVVIFSAEIHLDATGADDHLSKSSSMEHVVDRLRAVLIAGPATDSQTQPA